MNEKGRQTKLLAAIAVLAMVVCALAVALPAGETSADTASIAGTDITGETTITVSDTSKDFYVSGNVSIATISGTGTAATFYLASNAQLTLPSSWGSVTSVTVKPAESFNDETGTITYFNGLIVSETTAAEVTYKATATGNGIVVPAADDATEYGVLINVDNAITAYPKKTDVGTVELKATTEDVTVKDGSASVTTVITKDTAKQTISTVSIDNVISTTGVKIGYTDTTGVATLANVWTAGSVTVDYGKVSVAASGLTSLDTNNATLNAFSSNVVTSSSAFVLGATVADVQADVTTSTDLYVYGDVASNQAVTLADDGTVNAVNANVTSLRIVVMNGETPVTVGTFTVSGTIGFTVDASNITESKLEFAAETTLTKTDLTLVNGTFVSATTSMTIDKDSSLTIASGAILEVGTYAANAFTVNGDMYVSGTIVNTGSNNAKTIITVKSVTTGDVEDQYVGTFKAFSGAKIPGSVTVEGTGSIDFSGMAGTKYVTGVTVGDETYYQSQVVEVVDYYDVDNSSKITIHGNLIVPENTTMTIRSGSHVTVDGVTSVIDIRGTLVVEEGATFTVTTSKNVNIYGNVTSSGEMTLNGAVEIKNGGTVTSDGKLTTGATSEFAVATGGNLNINGEFTIEKIVNKGTITLYEAEMTTTSTITLDADGAVVNVTSFTAAVNTNLVIQDKATTANKVTLDIDTASTGFSDIYVKESITKDDEGNNVYKMDISGAPELVYETTIPTNDTILTDGEGITITDSLNLGENIKLTVQTGNMSVSGEFIAVADGTGITATGTIDVTGMVQTSNNGITNDTTNVNAAKYKAKVENTTYSYYTTLKTAIDNGATSITMLGTTVVKEDIPVPTGVTVDNKGTLTIGDSKTRGITVSFADNAMLKGSPVTVNATLEFADSRDCSATIYSDVKVENAPAVTYTNIYTALENAGEGDTVTITSETGVVIDADLEIKQGVTLNVPAGRSISVNNDITITVNGTMTSYSGITGDFAQKESESAAALVVNGVFMTGQSGTLEDIYNDYKTAGAYYNIVDENGSFAYISPLAVAAESAQDAGTITVFGKNTAADISFIGTEEEPVEVVVADGAELIAGTITLQYATLTIGDARFDGTVSSGTGSVEIVNSKNISVASKQDADENMYLAVSGAPAVKDSTDSAPDFSVTIASGTVYAESTVTSTASTAFNIGDMTVAGGSNLVVDGDNEAQFTNLTVEGSASATDGGDISVSNNLVVLGTFTVGEADVDAGTESGHASATNVYVGISDKDVDVRTAAALNADSLGDELAKVYVSAESTVTADLVDGMKSSEFYVEDALFLTVYVSSGKTVYINSIDYPALSAAEIDCWQYTNNNGKLVEVTNQMKVGDANTSEIIGKVNYDVYRLVFTIEYGITDVYVDGDLVATTGMSGHPEGTGENRITYDVAAGSHTITYRLNNYFAGDIKITLNGETLTDGKFTITNDMPFVEDDDQKVVYSVVITGVEAAAPENPTTPSSGSSDDGMGLTDYLLIVLVILIVVMAIMVAVRLMRS